jgi:hypothetical protein
MKMETKDLNTLIPLEDFMTIFGIDDREDRLARFCLVTATLTIEQYCKRRLMRKKFFERIEFNGDLLLPLREYPVSEILAVYVKDSGELLEPELHEVVPDCGTDYDFPFAISLSPAVRRMGLKAVKAVYIAGYAHNNVPADLASACLELASWNISRYKGRRVGMTGNIKGAGKEGEHFEMSMPENVKVLLEAYKRRLM